MFFVLFVSSVPDAKKRWYNLRDAFNREVKKQKNEQQSGSGVKKRTPWRYFKDLFFLKEAREKREYVYNSCHFRTH